MRYDYITNNHLLSDSQKKELEAARSHPYRSPHIKKYLAAIHNQDSEPVEEKAVTRELEKVGITAICQPRNVAEIEQLFEKLTYFLEDRENIKYDKFIQYGFDVAYKMFARPEDWVREGKYLSPLETYEDIKKATKMDKASGAPFFTRKGFVFDECWKNFQENILTGKKALPPATAYCRTRPENKTRLVFAQAVETIMLEGQFARPLIDYFTNHKNPMTIGFWSTKLGDWLSKSMTKRYVYTMDYSKYDMTISRKFIIKAFNILGTWFSPEDKIRLGWDMMVKNFIYTGIIMPDGYVYYGKKHGVPSGSYFTQMIDSVVNVAIIMALSAKFGLHVNANKVSCLGDDSIYCSYTWVSTYELAEYAEKNYRIVIHPDKSEILDTHVCRVFHYLGQYWYLGVPHQREEDLYSRMISPERRRHLRFDEDNYFESMRMIHTIIKAYCSLCDEGMKLAQLMHYHPFEHISYYRVINQKRALPGLVMFKLETEEQIEMESSFRFGIFGMYAK